MAHGLPREPVLSCGRGPSGGALRSALRRPPTARAARVPSAACAVRSPSAASPVSNDPPRDGRRVPAARGGSVNDFFGEAFRKALRAGFHERDELPPHLVGGERFVSASDGVASTSAAKGQLADAELGSVAGPIDEALDKIADDHVRGASMSSVWFAKLWLGKHWLGWLWLALAEPSAIASMPKETISGAAIAAAPAFFRNARRGTPESVETIGGQYAAFLDERVRFSVRCDSRSGPSPSAGKYHTESARANRRGLSSRPSRCTARSPS